MTDTTRRALIGAGLTLPFAASAFAETPPVEETWEQRWQRELREDFGMLGRYRDDNARILAAGEAVDIVFMGDSITQGWRDKQPGFFTPGRVGRGISGQTTSQMVLRMIADVVALKPKAVHVMAGTNDVAGNTGPMTPEMTRNNFRAMSAIAQHHGIRVLLASIPPADAFPWRPGLDTVEPIRAHNRWLKDFAASTDAIFVDYDPVLATPTGAMREGLAHDGVHPTEAGYNAMATAIEPVLAKVLA